MFWIRCAAIALTTILGIQANCLAQSIKEASESYEKARELGTELFGRFMSKNSGSLRTSATLNACKNPALARSVHMKIPDHRLVEAVDAMMSAGRFRGYQPDLALQSQSVATSMIAGYAVGYEDAIELLPDPLRKALCQIAEEAALSR